MAELTREPIDTSRVLESVASPGAGCSITFGGTVRDLNRGRTVLAIDYHAYETMALEQLGRIEEEVRERWPDTRVSIVHRLGHLEVGELSVLIAVSSPHRAGGYPASQYAIDRIKEIVPIWKKEIYPDGHAWIEGS